MLENKYGEYEALENQRILMERMNVETQEEIDAIIKEDMEDFVAYTDSKMDESIDNYYEFYTEFNSWFDDFFESYTDNLSELAKLNEQFLSLLNVEDYLKGNGMNVGDGIGTLGTLSQADREAIYSKVDMNENYALRMEEAIRDENYDLAQEYALLREAKANKSDKIVLGQGNYKTNQQVWDDAMKKYGKTYSEEVNKKINEVQEDVKAGNIYNSQNLNANIQSNNLSKNQTTQLSKGLVDVSNSANKQGENIVETVKQTGKDIIDAIGSKSVDSTNMSRDEFNEALKNGANIGGVHLDPNKKAPVYESADKDPGVVGSSAWYESQGKTKPSSSSSKSSISSTAAKVGISAGLGIVSSVTKKYASGLEEGPVTYTGLAMLHGTPNEPEYVLNNDQAYNLLYNMSSAKMAEFESKESSNGTQYIVQGDIILEGIDDPAAFWQEVTNAMGNRWNVTKNR